MRKKIVAISAIMAFLMILYAKSVVAQNDVTLHVWTDSVEYAPGETGTLYIVVRNDLPDTDLIIKNLTIVYDTWHAYVKDHWEGNETFIDINEVCEMKGGVYIKEVTFKVPTDGRGITADANVTVTTDKAINRWRTIRINVVGPPLPMKIEDIDVWMTSLTMTVVVCTIILAIVIFLSTRRARAPRAVAPSPPPPKAKAA